MANDDTDDPTKMPVPVTTTSTMGPGGAKHGDNKSLGGGSSSKQVVGGKKTKKSGNGGLGANGVDKKNDCVKKAGKNKTSTQAPQKSSNKTSTQALQKSSNKTPTQGPHKISKDDKKDKKGKKDKIPKKEKTCKNTPVFRSMKKVRFGAQVKTGLSHIFDQLVVFPDKKLAETFMKNGIADVDESRDLSPLDASKNRKDRAISYLKKTRQSFVGREAANTLLVVFYNPASVCFLIEEIYAKNNDIPPANVLVVRFESSFVVIVTDVNIAARFPCRSWMETGDSSSCFLWFNIKDVSWNQKFQIDGRMADKMTVLQKASPLSVVGHVLVAYFQARSQPWGSDSTASDKINYHIYLKPYETLHQASSPTMEDTSEMSWVQHITTFVSRFSFVKAKSTREKMASTSNLSSDDLLIQAVTSEVVEMMVSQTVEEYQPEDILHRNGADGDIQEDGDGDNDHQKDTEEHGNTDDARGMGDEQGTGDTNDKGYQYDPGNTQPSTEGDQIDDGSEFPVEYSSGVECVHKSLYNTEEEIDMGVCGLDKNSEGYLGFDQHHDYYDHEDTVTDAVRVF